MPPVDIDAKDPGGRDVDSRISYRRGRALEQGHRPITGDRGSEQADAAVGVDESSGWRVSERGTHDGRQRLGPIRTHLEEGVGRDPEANTSDLLVEPGSSTRRQL